MSVRAKDNTHMYMIKELHKIRLNELLLTLLSCIWINSESVTGSQS